MRSRAHRVVRKALASLTLAGALFSLPARAPAAVSLGGWMAHSPDDLGGGFVTLAGNDATANITLPFTFTVEGTAYTLITQSTNGWIEFGTSSEGTSDPTNECLPTAAHTNPFLAAFWDDMQMAGSSSIEHGTVGTSPNRTFLVDYFLDTKVSGDDGDDDVELQVQIHERSNAIIVKYRHAQVRWTGDEAVGAEVAR
jgi:hypothetical protein